MQNSPRQVWACALVLVLLGAASPFELPAATNLVFMRHVGTITARYVYDPTNITINAGDTILWTNAAPLAHDTTHRPAPPDRLWASGNLSANQTFRFTFTNTGVYPYFCQFHALTHPEQTGSVSVASINLPPTVTLTSPTNGTALEAGENLELTATASDPGGGVTQVEFFNGTNSLGVDTTLPYTLLVPNPAPGAYALTARARDTGGLTATSAVANITVRRAITISAPRLDANGHFQFDYTADPGLTYVIRRSQELDRVNPQIPYATNVATNAVMTFTDTNRVSYRIYSIFRER